MKETRTTDFYESIFFLNGYHSIHFEKVMRLTVNVFFQFYLFILVFVIMKYFNLYLFCFLKGQSEEILKSSLFEYC